jgi:hypothetical protein
LRLRHARLFRGICARACRPCFRAGLGILGGTGPRTRPLGLTTSAAIAQVLSAKKGVRPKEKAAVMPPHAETCLRTLVRKRARTPLSRLPFFLTRTLGAAPEDLERTRLPTEPPLRREYGCGGDSRFRLGPQVLYARVSAQPDRSRAMAAIGLRLQQ